MTDFDRAQLKNALAGDAAEMRALIEYMAPVVRARVARAVGRRFSFNHADLSTDIADFTQEVFVALFENDAKALRAWNPERGLSFLNFVGLLAQRRVAGMLRTSDWRVRSEQVSLHDSQMRSTGDAEIDGEASATVDDTLKRLLEYLEATLSIRALDMFDRLFIREHTVEQIGEETGMSAAAVYQWRSRLAKAARDGMSALELQDAKRQSGPRLIAGAELPRAKASWRGRGR